MVLLARPPGIPELTHQRLDSDQPLVTAGVATETPWTDAVAGVARRLMRRVHRRVDDAGPDLGTCGRDRNLREELACGRSARTGRLRLGLFPAPPETRIPPAGRLELVE